jgi:hypothetical protein
MQANYSAVSIEAALTVARLFAVKLWDTEATQRLP